MQEMERKVIYLDHAATVPVKKEVLEAMLPFFAASFANPSSGYLAARETRKAIDSARNQIANAIGAKREEVYFTSGGSEANNWALKGYAAAHPEKIHIITTSIEHHAVLNACQALERQGYEVTYLEVDSKAGVSPEVFERAIRPDTLMASVMLANNEVGTIEPVAKISEIAHAHGIPVHTDAVQAVGHIPVNVNALGVDMLSMSAHKFAGPKGIGALYVRSGTRLDNLIDGGAQERTMRAGTENTPAIVGMGLAAEIALAQMPDAFRYVSQLRDDFQEKLEALDGIRINGDQINRLPGHLHITVEQANTQLLLMQLDMANIAVSAGSACSSGAAERSHVIRAMGLAGENQADVRFSIGENNTASELEQVFVALRRILKR